jgi:hypothetical protein
VFILFTAEEDEEVDSFAPVFLLGNYSDFFFLFLPAHTASVTWKGPGELSDINSEDTKKQSAEEVARRKNPATDWLNPRRKKERRGLRSNAM